MISIRFVFLAFALTLSCSMAAFACNPALAAVCQRCERAEAVFVGTLTKAERKSEGSFTVLYATFTVKESYKGSIQRVEIIKFGTGECDPAVDKVGETYFVYKEPYRRILRVANYTHLLGQSVNDLAFAKQINSRKPIFRISGFLSGLAKADLPKARIVINDGRRNKNVSLDRDGWYKYATRRPGAYKITVLLPIEANIGWEQLGVYSDFVEGTSFTYETAFRPNGCDERQINISPK